MLTYLGYFSTSFTIAIVMWPILSAVLTLPILAGLYHRHHRMKLLSAGAAYLTVLYVLGLIAFTLYPMPDDPEAFCAANAGQFAPQLDPLRFISDIQNGGLSGILQLVMNVVLFMPLGFVLTRWLRWRWWAVLIGGFAVSLFIESSQLSGFWGLYPCAYRQFDVNDLMTNTLGAMAGLAVAVLFGKWVPLAHMPERSEYNEHPGAVHRLVTFIIDMVFVALVYVPLTLLVTFLFYWAAEPLQNGDFMLFGGHLTVGVGWLNFLAPIGASLAFLIFEFLIPLGHKGRTLGGMYTHMTIETKPRKGIARAVFYILRTLIMGAMVVMFIIGFGHNAHIMHYTFYGFVILFLFAVFAHRMPWDFVPGSSVAPAPAVPVYGAADVAAAPAESSAANAHSDKEGAATVAGDDAVPGAPDSDAASKGAVNTKNTGDARAEGDESAATNPNTVGQDEK